jgi:hypothetical protein
MIIDAQRGLHTHSLEWLAQVILWQQRWTDHVFNLRGSCEWWSGPVDPGVACRLQGCVFTKNINQAIYISDAMSTGTIQINAAPARGPDHFPFQVCLPIWAVCRFVCHVAECVAQGWHLAYAGVVQSGQACNTHNCCFGGLLQYIGLPGQWHRLARHQELLGDDVQDQELRHQPGSLVLQHGIGRGPGRRLGTAPQDVLS